MTNKEAVSLAQQWQTPGARPMELTATERTVLYADIARRLRAENMTVPVWLGGDAAIVEPQASWNEDSLDVG